MPRGRHRHSPPLHRLLPPSAIAGVSVVCALGPWVFAEAVVLRGLAAAAAVTAVAGAVVMRRWDSHAGKQVADLTRARASDEWRHEERVAELESALEESRELRAKLEQRLRTKRAELAGLRNEHAALLRRYATAETERASALEGRRLLEIEAATPARALPPVPVPVPVPAQAAVPVQEGERESAEEKPAVPRVFSPEGTQLFVRARAALARLDSGSSTEGAGASEEPVGPEASKGAAVRPGGDGSPGSPRGGGVPRAGEDEAPGKPEAADGHEREAAHRTAPQAPQSPNGSGHFAVPTAVAVVPQGPGRVRRPSAEGGFDFFGTKKQTSGERDALESVQNEDLADVVGQEALALHKAETEARFKPADEEAREARQVIDLTAHDETEQIDLQGLRSAAS